MKYREKKKKDIKKQFPKSETFHTPKSKTYQSETNKSDARVFGYFILYYFFFSFISSVDH